MCMQCWEEDAQERRPVAALSAQIMHPNLAELAYSPRRRRVIPRELVTVARDGVRGPVL